MLHRLLEITLRRNEAKRIVAEGPSNNIKSEDELKSYAEEIKNKLISDGIFSIKVDGGVLTVTYLSDDGVIYDDHRSAVYFEGDKCRYAARSEFNYIGYIITSIDSAVDLFIKRSLGDPGASA